MGLIEVLHFYLIKPEKEKKRKAKKQARSFGFCKLYLLQIEHVKVAYFIAAIVTQVKMIAFR
jgi:hypothetical protein